MKNRKKDSKNHPYKPHHRRQNSASMASLHRLKKSVPSRLRMYSENQASLAKDLTVINILLNLKKKAIAESHNRSFSYSDEKSNRKKQGNSEEKLENQGKFSKNQGKQPSFTESSNLIKLIDHLPLRTPIPSVKAENYQNSNFEGVRKVNNFGGLDKIDLSEIKQGKRKLTQSEINNPSVRK